MWLILWSWRTSASPAAVHIPLRVGGDQRARRLHMLADTLTITAGESSSHGMGQLAMPRMWASNWSEQASMV